MITTIEFPTWEGSEWRCDRKAPQPSISLIGQKAAHLLTTQIPPPIAEPTAA
ncbi:hypothetical protein [Pseudanabaena sp. FACHB-2040]|uniref:hypothetical protein n=1 Tax=Pseudanabaena sp. FACHB-2040 TaxID=2692859 RepID=UPI0016886F5B|nr:hypothetical protein [Pseudanabaena sp. FACHB-2040]MBD2256444.1 hypothetical protein [Pseudanabaena sp. FACHB-2040]